MVVITSQSLAGRTWLPCGCQRRQAYLADSTVKYRLYSRAAAVAYGFGLAMQDMNYRMQARYRFQNS